MPMVPSLQKHPRRRSGKVLIMLALMLTLLMGMAGLVIDSGLLHAAHRQVQNAADSAALAAAMELYGGKTVAQAKTAATTFVTNYNGLTKATVTVNIPPSTGPNAGNVKYAEVYVSNSSNTHLMQLLGASSSQTVSARAVAGYENLAYGEGAIVLDPAASPGITITGGATLNVDGSVIVNSQGAGVDQYGVSVDWGQKKYGASTSNNSTVKARLVQIRGGVDTPDNFLNYDPAGANPIYARSGLSPDPLRVLPIPTNKNGVITTNYGAVSINTKQTLNPGIYSDIRISNGGNVTFNPGIYVLSPTKANQGLVITGSPVISGKGVMFYLTGSTYYDATKKAYGYWDQLDDTQNSYLDGPLPPTNGASIGTAPDPGKVTYASLTINATAATVTFTGLANSGSPFNNVLFYQRRRNSTAASIAGNAGPNVTLGGTIYGKWANFSVSGQGKYDAQFIVGSMNISGGANVTIHASGKNYGLANQVFLTE